MTDDIQAQMVALQERATHVKALLPLAPRPFVIEFAGTPKAGKSTSVEAIRHFFSRSGFRVHVLIERASVCPIPMKGHLFFNTWCAATMLAELLANIDTEADIIIVDRGLFDALVWLTMQRQRGELTNEEATTIENFILLDRWRKLTDLAVVMNVTAEQALQRENSQRITSQPGSIMNPEVLSTMSGSVDTAVGRYGPAFGNIIKHDTTGESPQVSNVRLAQLILDHIEAFIDPKILVLPRREVESLRLTQGGCFSAECRDELVALINAKGRSEKRSIAEKDGSLVQVIPSGVLTYKDQVFVFERKDRDPKSQLYGRATIWQGVHVRADGEQFGLEILESALRERLQRYLFLSRNFEIEFKGYCWDQDDDQSCLHLGVIFFVRVDDEHTATDLRKKEFKRGRGYGLAGQFASWSKIAEEQEALKLESWSQSIVRNTSR